MTIEWNKVTWYSKLLAVVLALVIFYVAFKLGFGFGKEKADIEKIDTNGVSVETPQKKSELSSAPIKIDSQSIKEENFSGTMPIISGSSPVAAKARAYIEQKITEFRTQANKDVPATREKFGEDSAGAKYEIDIDAKYIQSAKTESIVMSIYAFTGGANGNSSYNVITASRSNGKILSLSDIIKADKQNSFTEFVKKELNAWRPDSNDTVVFPDEVKNLKFISFSNWSLIDKDLVIYFDKYQIGPGYLGAVAFPLPLAKIEDFVLF